MTNPDYWGMLSMPEVRTTSQCKKINQKRLNAKLNRKKKK